jgi:hypothetical protein
MAPSLAEVFLVIKEFLPLITVGGSVITAGAGAVGLIPRIGPGRAAMIALRSRFAFKPVPVSIRSKEVNLMRRQIGWLSGQAYIVVTGQKGVGKTCLVSTVTPGDTRVVALPGDSASTIIRAALQQLTRLKFDWMPPFDSAKRVIFWHWVFTLGQYPVVVIAAAERSANQGYASLTGAVRTLVDEYKLRVIVDGSPNALDESVLRTTRNIVFDVKPMTKEMIWKLGQLQDLFKYVKTAGLDDIVFAVLGGIPSDYTQLWDNCSAGLENGEDAREVIGTQLCAEVSAAIKLVTDAQDMDGILALFDKDKNYISRQLVKEKNLTRPSPDKVLREVEQDDDFVLIPASNAIGIVLRHQLTKKPTLNELEELVKREV